MEKQMVDAIEREIDRHGLAFVVNTIAIIARAKAEHVAANWQDRALARQWDRAAGRLETVSRFFSNRGL